MWWKQNDKQESPYLAAALGFLAGRSDIQLEGHCKTCDAYQPIYLQQLLETHGKAAVLRDILPSIPCLFCRKPGAMAVRIIEG